MDREETKKKLEEAIELMITHLGDSHMTWEIQERIDSSREKYLVLNFEVEYEDDKNDKEEMLSL